ncbi:MAG: SDR family oxidoreductase [Variovorax sp.]|nr:MAG: SDR family oxidoreductase [Variovorax sp.]
MTATPAHSTRWLLHPGLKGAVALVAGGGSGIGEAAAHTLAAGGAHLVVADRRPDMAQRVAADLAASGAQAIAIGMDVTSQSDIDAAVAQLKERFGRLDMLVNTAGVIMPAELESLSLEDWRQTFAVNVDGALMLARSCLPLLRESALAAIVNVSSLAGGRGYPNGGAYGPSKAALISLSRQMALEWAPLGIRVNTVNPGTVDTPLTRANMRDEVIRDRESRIPLRRMGQADELGNLIAFLASPAASFITAQDINCDGGLSQTLMTQKFYANA